MHKALNINRHMTLILNAVYMLLHLSRLRASSYELVLNVVVVVFFLAFGQGISNSCKYTHGAHEMPAGLRAKYLSLYDQRTH